MESHQRLTDQQFMRRFADCTLEPEAFNHEAHLRLAYILITQHGVDKAIEIIEPQLIQYVNHVGASDKYHKTLTIAAVKVVNHFLCKSRSKSFQAFLLEFPKLKHNFKSIIDQHYGVNIFTSEFAKKEYVEPDKIPFA